MGAVALACAIGVYGQQGSTRVGPWRTRSGRDAYVGTAVIVSEFPHDPSAFTQGLCFDDDGNLYESDGIYRKSAVRRVDVASGRSLRHTANEHKYFGEGATVINGSLYQLTWREGAVHEFGLGDLDKVATRKHPMREGWGLAYDAARNVVYGTEGSNRVYVFSDATLATQTRPPLSVTDPELGGLRIEGLNELEMVEGELWANVLPLNHRAASPCVARIDVGTGAVIGWVDLSLLRTKQSAKILRERLHYVTNGIAYRTAAPGESRPTLYATGKMWEKMFDVDVDGTDLGPRHVAARCDLYIPPGHAAAKIAHRG